MDILFDVDIESLLDDLRAAWVNSEKYRYNDTAFTKQKPSGNSIQFCCPFHHEKRPSCGIMLDYPYGYHCFTCDESGNLIQLVSYVFDVNALEAMQLLMRSHVAGGERKKINIEKYLKGGGKEYTPVPEELIEKYKNKRHTYLYSRGFSERTLKTYEIGYDVSTNMITIPVRDSKGIPRFIKRRYIHNKRYYNDEVPRKDILYGLYYIIKSGKRIQEISVTEGEFDVLACYESGIPAVGLLGRKLFEEQVLELMKANIKKVNLFFDNDKQGQKGALQAYELLQKTPIQVTFTLYPSSSCKDPNDLLIHHLFDEITIVSPVDYLTNLSTS